MTTFPHLVLVWHGVQNRIFQNYYKTIQYETYFKIIFTNRQTVMWLSLNTNVNNKILPIRTRKDAELRK